MHRSQLRPCRDRTGWPLKDIAHFQKAVLHIVPRRVRSITKHSTLRLIFRADDGRKCWLREESIAPCETHAFREEIALGKIRSADLVVVRFDCGVFSRAEHGLDFRVSG